MKNPIAKIALFATPASTEALQDYLLTLSGSERTVAITAAAMAWNLAHELVAEANKEMV